MFCSKCGSEIQEGGKFCNHCGAPLVEENDDWDVIPLEPDPSYTPEVNDLIYNLPELETSNGSGVHCPRCKSKKIQALLKSDVKGGYRVGRGCLGWLLFGPLGLLCGAIGKKSKVTVINETMFVCTECGFGFSHIEDMIEERERQAKFYLIAGIALLVLSIIVLFDSFSFKALGLLIFPLACAGWYIMAKEELNDLISKGYDASCFMKKDE